MGASGSLGAIWLANLYLDNEGGNIHRAYYYSVRASAAYSAIMAYDAYYLNLAYYTSEGEEKVDEDAVTTASDKWLKKKFFNIYLPIGDETTYYTSTETNHQLYLWIAAFAYQLFSTYAIPAIS